MPRGKKSRPRAARGRPAEPRRSNVPVAAAPEEWVFVPVPALVDKLIRRSFARLTVNSRRTEAALGKDDGGRDTYYKDWHAAENVAMPTTARRSEIGRASCREREESE